MSLEPNTQQIQLLNDTFRTTFTGGTVVLTAGIQALPDDTRSGILQAVRTFNNFTPDNDPHLEHDFGSFLYEGVKVFWKMDYYDATLTYGSENPADSTQTRRVLTIMLASEY
jgi:hypothetical protein